MKNRLLYFDKKLAYYLKRKQKQSYWNLLNLPDDENDTATLELQNEMKNIFHFNGDCEDLSVNSVGCGKKVLMRVCPASS